MPNPSPARQLGALLLVDEARWHAVVRAALEAAAVDRGAADLSLAARTLGVSRRTMQRWVRDHPAIAAGLPIDRGGGWRPGHSTRRSRYHHDTNVIAKP